MNELFGKIKELAKKKGCNIELIFYKFGDCVLSLDFGFGLNKKYFIDIPDIFLDKNDVDRFMKWVNYLIDYNIAIDKNNHNLNVISDKVDGIMDSYTGICTKCDKENCFGCNIPTFLDELKKLNKTISELKDKD